MGAALCSPVFWNTAVETECEVEADVGFGVPWAAAGAIPPPNGVVRLHGRRGSLDPLRQHQAKRKVAHGESVKIGRKS